MSDDNNRMIWFREMFAECRESDQPIQRKSPWKDVYKFYPSGYLKNLTYQKSGRR